MMPCPLCGKQMTEREGTAREGGFEFKLYDCHSAYHDRHEVQEYPPRPLCEATVLWEPVGTPRVTEGGHAVAD